MERLTRAPDVPGLAARPSGALRVRRVVEHRRSSSADTARRLLEELCPLSEQLARVLSGA